MPMQRSALPPPAFLVLFLLGCVATLPLCAQRGHAAGGSSHASGGGFSGHGPSSGGFSGGGFSSHLAPPSHSGFSGSHSMRPGPSRFMQPGRGLNPYPGMRASRNLIPNPGGRRPEYGGHPGNPGGDHHHPHRPAYNYGGATFYTGSILPYGYPYGYGYGYGDLGFPYDEDYDDSNVTSASPATDDNDYAAGNAPEAPAPPDSEAPSSDAPYNSPYNYGSPQPAAAAPKPAPAPPQQSVTLVFNNGAPTQQIRNYILSRTTLTVLDGHRREIPIADLDLAATQKANRAAGIDFQLPSNNAQ